MLKVPWNMRQSHKGGTVLPEVQITFFLRKRQQELQKHSVFTLFWLPVLCDKQSVPYIWTFKLWAFKDVNVYSINVRCEWGCSLPSITYCWRSFSCTVFPPLSPSVSNSSCLFIKASPCIPVVLLYYYTFPRYCTVMLKMLYFLCLFFMYYLHEKYYKPIIVQYYIANCVSWVTRLTWLDLQTNWT